MTPVPSAPTFASLLQDFFCQRLMSQRNVSARTVASYRDTFRLLLRIPLIVNASSGDRERQFR